jgi:hypothetical protein
METHILAGDELVARPLGKDPSVEKHVGAVAERERFADVVIGDQDADPARAKIEQDAVERLDHERVDSGEWLVEEQESWFERQTPSDLDSPLFPSRELRRRHRGEMPYAELPEDLLGPPARLRAVDSPPLEHPRDVVLRSERV